jgi:hypothetical protein
MTQYPNSFLQSESQPWGRSIEQRLADLERQDRLVAQESNNNLSQINGTLDRLTQFSSVADLRTEPFADFGGFSAGYSLYNYEEAIDPSVTIVSNTGKILVTVSAQCSFLNTANTRLSVFLQPECIGVEAPSAIVPGLVLSSTSVVNVGYTSSFTRLYALPPGEYEFRLRLARQLNISGGSQAFSSTYRLLIAQSIP